MLTTQCGYGTPDSACFRMLAIWLSLEFGYFHVKLLWVSLKGSTFRCWLFGGITTVVVGHRESSIPHSYLVDGKPVGYSMDVCAAIVDTLKKRFEFAESESGIQGVTSSTRIPEIKPAILTWNAVQPRTASNAKSKPCFQNHYVTELRMVVKKVLNQIHRRFER